MEYRLIEREDGAHVIQCKDTGLPDHLAHWRVWRVWRAYPTKGSAVQALKRLKAGYPRVITDPGAMTKLEFALSVPVFAVGIYVFGKVLGVL